MKRISLLAVPLLVVGLLAGCGDDGGDGGGDDAADAPKNATVEEFCQPFVNMYEDVVSKGEDISDDGRGEDRQGHRRRSCARPALPRTCPRTPARAGSW